MADSTGSTDNGDRSVLDDLTVLARESTSPEAENAAMTNPIEAPSRNEDGAGLGNIQMGSGQPPQTTASATSGGAVAPDTEPVFKTDGTTPADWSSSTPQGPMQTSGTPENAQWTPTADLAAPDGNADGPTRTTPGPDEAPVTNSQPTPIETMGIFGQPEAPERQVESLTGVPSAQALSVDAPEPSASEPAPTFARQTMDTLASPPTLSASGVKGSEDTAIALSIHAGLTDIDGSESLSVKIEGIPNDASLNHGARNSDGSWSVAAADLGDLKLTPGANMSGDLHLTVTATSTESGNGATATTSQVFTVHVDAVADAPSLNVGAPMAETTQATPLSTITVRVGEDYFQGDAQFQIYVDGQPVGAVQTVTASHQDGQWQDVSVQGDFGPDGPGKVEIRFLNDAWSGTGGVDRNLYVESVTVNGVTFAGSTATGKGVVEGSVMDMRWNGAIAFDTHGATPIATIAGHEDGPIPLNISSGLADTDGSESLSVRIEGVPADATLNHGTHNADGSWTLSQADLSGLTITAPTPGEIHLAITATSTEAQNGDSASITQSLTLVVDKTMADTISRPVDSNAVADTVLENSANGAVVGITAHADSPTGQDVVYTLTDDAGGRFQIDSHTGVVTVKDGTLLDYETATKHVITVDASDGTSHMSQNYLVNIGNVDDTASAPTLSVTNVSGNEDTVIGLKISSALTDTDGSETLSVKITGVPDDAILNHGTHNADGSWTLSQADLTGLTLTPGANYNGKISLTIAATSTESNGGAQATLTKSEIVTVKAVNDAPVNLTDQDGAANAVVEHASTGTVVGVMAGATDVDGDTLTYSLTNNAGGRFAINASTGVVTVANGALLDASSATSHAITVSVSDGRGGVTTQSFAINVTPGNGGQFIEGTASSETLTGTGGDDIIHGAGGNDVLVGGAGDDRFLVGAGDGRDSFDGGAGTDTIKATADGTVIGIAAMSSIENITADGHANVTIGMGNYSSLNFSGATLTGIGEITAGVGNTIVGSGGADTIRVGQSDNIQSGGGNDTILVGAGNGLSSFDGGTGTDTIKATADGMVIGISSITSIENITADGHANVTIGMGNYSTLDFSGATLTGIGEITAGVGNTIVGSGRADTIRVGQSDNIQSGGGNDTILVGAGNGLSGFDGGAGTDTIKATADGTVIGISSITSIENITADGHANVTIGMGNYSSLNFSGATLTGITEITAGVGNTITGSAGDDVIRVGQSDTLSGGNGDDTFLVGGASNGLSSFTGGAGADTIRATSDGTVIGISALSGVENITADGHANVTIGMGNYSSLNFSGATLTGITEITAGVGNTITGSAGDDVIRVGQSDTLSGGNGDDTFLVGGASNGLSSFTGGAGADTIKATSDGTVIGISALSGLENITADGHANVTIGMGNYSSLNFSGATLTGITEITAGVGNTITGSAGDDVIRVGQSDTLSGGNGDDTFLVGGASNGLSSFTGGAGADTIKATSDGTVIGISALSGVENITADGHANVTIGMGNYQTLNLSGTTLDGISQITAGVGNTITGSHGNDVIDVTAGGSTINFSGKRHDYIVSQGADSHGTYIQVQDVRAGATDGTDRIYGDANFHFSNTTLNSTTVLASANAGPSAISDANAGANSVAENSAVGTVVGVTARATDADGDTLTYSLTNDAGGKFAINSSTGVVTVAGALDYETATSHTITVQVDDGHGGVSTQNFTVGVTNVNEAPTSLSDSNAAANTVTEHVANGTAVGITAQAIDPDGDTLTYSLTDDAGGRFAINASTGVVTVADGSKLDALTNASHTITVQANDGHGGLTTQAFTINVAEAAGPHTVSGTSGNDRIDRSGEAGIAGNATGDTINAMAGNDHIIGTARNDVIDGGAGADYIQAGAGDDTMNFSVDGAWSGGYYSQNTFTGETATIRGMNASHDVFDGGTGHDQIIGTSGNDALFLDDPISAFNPDIGSGPRIVGVEEIHMGAGNDLVDMTSNRMAYGDILIDGGTGDDVIFSSAGNDTLIGGAGNDRMDGGAGNDAFLVGAGDGFDSISGGAGTDTVKATADHVVIGLSRIDGVEQITANGHSGVSIAAISTGATLDFSATTLTNISHIDGGAGNDTITGSTGSDLIMGGGGHNVLYSGGGNDTLIAGTNLLQNGDFTEQNGGATFTTVSAGQSIGHWNVTHGSVDVIGGLWSSPHGQQSIDLNGSSVGGIAQTLTTEIGKTYTVHFQMAGNEDAYQGDRSVHVSAGDSQADFTWHQADHASASHDNMGFENHSFTFTATSTSTSLAFESTTTGNQYCGAVIADVQLVDTTTSAPGSELHGGAGASILIGSGGNDTFYSGGGNDTMIGGAGSDLFYLDGNHIPQNVMIDGGAGGGWTDTIHINNSGSLNASEWTMTLDHGSVQGNGSNYVDFSADAAGTFHNTHTGADIHFTGIERLEW